MSEVYIEAYQAAVAEHALVCKQIAIAKLRIERLKASIYTFEQLSRAAPRSTGETESQ